MTRVSETHFRLERKGAPPLYGTVMITPSSLTISFAGHGDAHSSPGNGSQVMIENGPEGVVVDLWADVNKVAPTHSVNLSGALESRREVCT